MSKLTQPPLLPPPFVWSQNDPGRKLSNLALSFLILPKEERKNFERLYAFCRCVDDIADDPQLYDAVKLEQLDAWVAALKGERPLPQDLQELIEQYHMDLSLFLAVVEGMRKDIGKVRYATFDLLRDYCWSVASAVGLLCMQLFGGRTEAHRHYAENLGLALQLTNILRDVAEDASMGRIYLPLDDLKRFRVSEEEILSGTRSDRFYQLMEFEATRAHDFYQRACAALSVQERNDFPTAEIMRKIYQAILQKMQCDGFRIYDRRYKASHAQKLWFIISTWFASTMRKIVT